MGQLPADRHQCLHRVLVRIGSSVVSSLAAQVTKIGLSVLSLVCHLTMGKSADLPNSLDTACFRPISRRQLKLARVRQRMVRPSRSFFLRHSDLFGGIFSPFCRLYC